MKTVLLITIMMLVCVLGFCDVISYSEEDMALTVWSPATSIVFDDCKILFSSVGKMSFKEKSLFMSVLGMRPAIYIDITELIKQLGLDKYCE